MGQWSSISNKSIKDKFNVHWILPTSSVYTQLVKSSFLKYSSPRYYPPKALVYNQTIYRQSQIELKTAELFNRWAVVFIITSS